jgi:hypothetical protein
MPKNEGGRKNMRTMRRYGLQCIVIVVGFLVVFSVVSNVNAYRSIASRSNGVTVDVKPMQFAAGKPAKFEVSMNTHSVDLSADLTAVSTLTDDQGKEYRPVGWEGDGPGGHHRSGVLEFPALEGTPKSVTLVIKDIASVPERVFQWELEE